MKPACTYWWASKRRYVNRTDSGAYGGFYTQDEAQNDPVCSLKTHYRYPRNRNARTFGGGVGCLYATVMLGHSLQEQRILPGKRSYIYFPRKCINGGNGRFPSEYIHIGGDEANKKPWKTCPNCKKE